MRGGQSVSTAGSISAAVRHLHLSALPFLLGVRGVAPCCHPPPKNAQIGSALAAASATDEATAVIRLDRGRPLGRYSCQTSFT